MLNRPLAHAPTSGRQIASGHAPWWVLYVGVSVVLLGLRAAGANVSRLLVDPLLAAGVADTSPWLGSLSNLGLMLWAAAAALCTLGAVVRHERGDRDGALALGATALLITALAADDAFLVHDHLLARITGMGWTGDAWLAVLGAATLAWLVRFGRHRPLWDHLLLLAGALFAVSLGIDLVPMHTGPVLRVPEDLAKLLGIVTVLRASARWAMAAVRLPARERSAAA